MNILKKYIDETTGNWVKTAKSIKEIFRNYEAEMLKRDLKVYTPPTGAYDLLKCGSLYFDFLRYHPEYDTSLNPDCAWHAFRLADLLDRHGYIKLVKLQMPESKPELRFVWVKRLTKEKVIELIKSEVK